MSWVLKEMGWEEMAAEQTGYPFEAGGRKSQTSIGERMTYSLTPKCRVCDEKQ